MSELNFYYATMGSGKSTYALQLNFSLKKAGFTPQLMKPIIDTRDYGVINSRLGLQEPCTMIDDSVTLSQHVYPRSTHVIVDEAQFLTREQVNELAYLVDFENITVYCFGLRTSYKNELFAGSAALMAIADNLIELPLIFNDGNKTVTHLRYVNGIPIFEGDTIQVGDIDTDDYESVSRRYYSVVRKQYVID